MVLWHSISSSRAYSSIQGLIDELARDAAWASWMKGARSALTIEEPQVYYDLPAPVARAVDIWETVYHQVMESPQPSSSGYPAPACVPISMRLTQMTSDSASSQLLVERVDASHPQRSDGMVLFPFRRISVIAYA